MLKRLPHGFATPLGNGTAYLDPSQSFRLALARASLRDPSVLVVEEPPPARNLKEDERTAQALADVSQGRTLVLLARRLETLRDAHRVVLIHEGEVAANGTHGELLQSSSIYRHANYMRFNPFESPA